MSRTMIQAAVTMNQLQSKMDLIGHNLANSQTPGYKTRKAEFSDLLAQQINNMPTEENALNRLTPDGIRVGAGARLGGITNDYAIGNFQTTDRALDVALTNENHFFQVQTDVDGALETRYTRDGSFYLQTTGTDGMLVLSNSDGEAILGANGQSITIQDGLDEIVIREDGEIWVERNGEMNLEGTIGVVNFTRPEVLEAADRNLFHLPDLDALGMVQAEIMQPVAGENVMESGVLEQSNIDLSEQITDLIRAQRSYQFNARTIATTDQMMGLVNQLRS